MQGDAQWKKDRAGKITGSRMADAMAYSKPKIEWCLVGSAGHEGYGGGKTGEARARAAQKKHHSPDEIRVELRETEPSKPLQARADYIAELATERLTGEPLEGFTAKATDYGKEVEPHGLAAYEADTGLIVQACEFIVHPDFPFVGASPDFLAGNNGGGELKCPYNSAVHLATLRNGMPEEHFPQVQTGLWVTRRKFWDFCSYDPRMPEHLRLYRQRVLPDLAYFAKLEAECLKVNAEVEALVAQFSVARAA